MVLARTAHEEGDPLAPLLSDLGFSEAEAAAYLALSASQPATAYEIAKVTGAPRANAYAAVSSLLARGAVQQVTERPARYAVVDPRHFFDGVARRTGEACTALASALQARSQERTSQFVTRVSGRKAVEETIVQAIGEAASSIHVKTVDDLARPFLSAIAERADSGVAVSIVASGPDWGPLADHPRVTLVPHEGTGSIPSAPHGVLFTMTVDSRSMVIASLADVPRAYVTTEGTVVYVIQTMILHEIYLAEIYAAIGGEALAAAGVSFEALRARHRPAAIGSGVFE